MPKSKKKEEAPIEMELGGLGNIGEIMNKLMNSSPNLEKDKDFTDFKLEEIRHKHRMLEIKTETDGKQMIENLRFDHQLQLQRVKTAEIKRTIDRKANRDFLSGGK